MSLYNDHEDFNGGTQFSLAFGHEAEISTEVGMETRLKKYYDETMNKE